MSETKYGKYFITVPDMEKLAFSAAAGQKVLGKTETRVYMSEKLVEGSDTHIVHIGIVDMPSKNPFTEDHVHPFNAIMMFVGLDMDDPEDLGGEIEYVLGEEEELHRSDKTNAIFLPAGLKHNVKFLRVDRPFLLIAVNLSGVYG